MEPAGNLLDVPYPSDVIIEHGAKYVANGSTDDCQHRIHARCNQQSGHHGLGTEGDKRAGKKGGKPHAPVTILQKEFFQVHT